MAQKTPEGTSVQRAKTRTFKMGAYSAALSALVILIVVAVNVFAGLLPASATVLDLSKEGFLDLSPETEEIVGRVSQPIHIYLVTQAGYEDNVIEQVLERYREMNSLITVSVIDPVASPTFMEPYTDETVYNNSLVVTSATRSKYIRYEEIYVANEISAYTAETAGQTTTDVLLEECLTGAIDFVTRETLPKLYVLSGHNEMPIDETLRASIERQNISVEELNLLTANEVPADCNALFLYSPTADPDMGEIRKIEAYLQRGGRLILITDHTEIDHLPNLLLLMEYYGVEAVSGVVMELDTAYSIQNNIYYLLPSQSIHDIMNPLIQTKKLNLMPIAHGLVPTEETIAGVTVSPLLVCSDSSYAKTDLGGSLEQADGDVGGPFALGMTVQAATRSGAESRLVWFTTSGMLNASVDSMVSGANTTMFLGALNWTCSDEDAVTIPAKNISIKSLVIPTAASTFWSAVLIGVVPGIFIAAGIAVWVVRRRR